MVSIPFRGFRCLQLNPPLYVQYAVLGFQSLSGVLGVCNSETTLSLMDKFIRFNPFQGF